MAIIIEVDIGLADSKATDIPRRQRRQQIQIRYVSVATPLFDLTMKMREPVVGRVSEN
jgi:hypothetical protein